MTAPVRSRPRRPLVVWDGDCSFCRRWIERWRVITGERVDYAPYQEVTDRFPHIPRERFRAAVHLITPDGQVFTGAEAVFRALAHAPGRGWLAAVYARAPGFAPVSEALYRFVAGHRPGLDRLTSLLWGPHLVPPGRTLTAWIFLRALGAVFLIAFVSLWVQIHGLVGERGIIPAGDWLKAVSDHFGGGPARFWFAPTLAWLGSGDGALHALCGTGAAAAALLTLGFVPVASLIACWACYLSLATIGQNFMWFQWDGLLLEAGFLSIFLAPRRWWSRPGSDPPPPRLAVWLLLWLLFRLMVSSAAVKLTSGDPTWRNLTALQYHYETQCLPTWLAWHAHHLPAWAHRVSVVKMLVIEGLVPLLILAPRRLRFAGAALLLALQGAIALTGNYGFFNLLAAALCVLMLDDGVWPWRWRRPVAPRAPEAPRRLPWGLVVPAAAAYLALSLVPFADAFRWPNAWLGPLPAIHRLLASFRTIDRYGLFAVMTTRRLEIVIEGSNDGVTWRPYEFCRKPGDPTRRPAFVAPHQPRLDWQMWFAALGEYTSEPWFVPFCRRLLEGSPPVLALMEHPPFEGSPPKYLRALVYDYHFTDEATRRSTGAWWRRELLGPYVPVLMLEGGRVTAVPQLGAP